MDNAETIPYGYCQCGCGQRTSLATCTNRRLGHTRGQPVFYVRGHGNRSRRPYIIEDRGYTTPCWIWQLWKSPEGYGHMSDGAGIQRLAHRVMWERAHGRPVPVGLQIDHLCEVPECVRPDHLEPVTNAENVRRSSTAKLTADDVETIRRLRADGVYLRVIAERYGVCVATVGHIMSGRNWRGS